MLTSRRLPLAFLSLVALFLFASPVLAADPGDPLDNSAGAVPNDQKPGSILFFNIYTSSTTNPGSQNTSITVTNTSDTQFAWVHLYFIDGNSCSVADRFFCLTNAQTMTFYADEQDPGVTGYIIAVAVDFNGVPRRFNYLIGVEYVKFASGHADSLAAESLVKFNDANVISADGALALLILDGLNLAGSYSLVPRVVAADNIPSRLDGNDTLVILNRTGGSLLTQAASLGNLFGILYDEAEQTYSFTITGGCQLRFVLNDINPRIVPRFTRIIPAGTVGWFKIWSTSNVGIFGAVFNFNPNAASGGGFNGGHNLHKLTLTVDAYSVPIFPPGC